MVSTDADIVKEFKDPERKFNVWASILIVSVLWGVLCTVIYKWGTSMQAENKQKDAKIATLETKVDSLTITQYHFVLDRLNQAEKVGEFKNSWDSLNTELNHIKQNLISK